MALKAEAPLLDYLKTSLKCKKEKAAAETLLPPRAPVRPDGPRAAPMDRAPGEQPVPNPVIGVGQEEAGSSWSQEYLIAKSSGRGRPVCMVCGGVLSASGAVAARKHILQHHAHSLDFSLEEKRNILEAWSEGVVLPKGEPQPSPAGNRSKSKQPAEIEVLLDSEEQPVSRKRGHLKARCEVVRLDPEQQSQGQERRHSLSNARDTRSKQPSKTTGKEWLSECGVPGSAPAEIRIFTDGTFPAGFALKLYCRTQPEPLQNSEAKPDPRKRTVDRNCSVSLLRLHSMDCSHQLCPQRDTAPRALGNSPGTNAKDCDSKLRQQKSVAGKEDASLLAKGFNPTWRARFLMDFDAAAGHLVCMVCENPLRRVCLASVKRHILQCHAETLHLPREVRRTIREVWESRGPSPTQAPRK
ncbi:spindlin interactor and repressor of chromatin-binding protein isoform X3 [Rhineura floridana]|nr:spindlin interactor and repressor of chromatin-binding protein isoform X3 [Rhineura floridana]XP_061461739.1 spindlin interactor and repressor of chromatin-binding protein isoform X3 [Rhineura floridana]XP_061461740.1 spindlin interactor and repressor of chromatin-binding protein isoform X3 [Rhineura floridana]